MKRGRQYDVFPRTWKSRVLLAVAFVAGASIMIGGWLFFFMLGGFTFDILGEVEVTVDNRTSETIIVYIDDIKEATVLPGQAETVTDLKLLWRFERRVEVVSTDGQVIYARRLDNGDLKRMDYRIVIEEP